MARTPWAPLVALVVVQFAFASLAVAGKYVLQLGLPPLALAALRVLFASLLFGILLAARPHERVPAADLGRLAVLSLLGVVFNQVLFIEGLHRTTAVNASVLIVTIPVFTLVAAVLLRRERFDRRRAAGVLVALVGTLLILRAERFELSDRVAVGNALVVLNCLSYSFYLVLSRDVLRRYSSLTVVAWTFLVGALVIVPLGTPDFARVRSSGLFDASVGLALVWIVLVPSVLAYGLNNWALKRVHSTTVASFIFLQPVFAVAMALALLPGEHLEPRTVLAGLLIAAGVLVVLRTEAAEPAAPTGKPISAEPVPAARGRP